MSMFTKAQKRKARLRLAIIGPAGSGKTRSALEIAAGLGSRIALIDTERESASLYSDLIPFDGVNLENFAPADYVKAIQAAEREGYDVLVIDSLSHAWSGKGGALEMVDRVAKTDTRGNSFNAWREVTPEHNKLVDAMLRCRCHLIVTMRTKTEYVIEKDERTGKNVPKKIGLAPIQREGLDYEFTVVGDIDLAHNLTITKTRCEALDGAVINKPGRELAATLIDWLESGAAEVTASPAPAAQDVSSAEPPPARPVHISEAAQVAPPAPVSTIVDALGAEVESLRSAIAAAGDAEALGLLVPRLTALPGKEKGELRTLYSARLTAVTPAPVVAGQ